VERARAPGRSTISFYGQDAADDNGIGLAGVTLAGFGSTPVMWKGTRVYPVAVAEKDWAQYAYKVLRISGKGVRTIYGVVVDACKRGNANCDKNVRTFNFLIDVHRTGFGAIGRSDGLVNGSFEVVGSLSAAAIPATIWQPRVRSGSSYLQCRTSNGKLDWVAFRDRNTKCRG
jgi:hypothetical protein